MRKPAISFDLGQTLVELDENLLLEQARRCGFTLTTALVTSEQNRAWQAYNASKANGKTGFDAWAAFVRVLLARVEFCSLQHHAPANPQLREAFVRFLWSEQPHNNLWRKPVSGMLDLVRTLANQGTKVGVLTNSEGRAKELVDQLGFGEFVRVVVDSGIEGIEKPDRRIFARLAERLQCAAADIVHVGDSYEADVLGALGAQMTPIWFVREPPITPPPSVLLCRNVSELGAALGTQ